MVVRDDVTECAPGPRFQVPIARLRLCQLCLPFASDKARGIRRAEAIRLFDKHRPSAYICSLLVPSAPSTVSVYAFLDQTSHCRPHCLHHS
jgi:hypothetical protein